MHNNVLNSFSDICAVFPPKKCFYSDFWAISIAGQNGGVGSNFGAYNVWGVKTCNSTPYRSKMPDVCREY